MTDRKPVPALARRRLAYSLPEACESLGVGETFVRTQILPDIKAIRVGRRTLIPVVELERWLDRHGARLALVSPSRVSGLREADGSTHDAGPTVLPSRRQALTWGRLAESRPPP